MQLDLPILSISIWLPILGGLWVIFAGAGRDGSSKVVALLVAVATFLASLLLWQGFDASTANMQFVERMTWIDAFKVEYHIGIDGIALPLILLTTFTSILVIGAGWDVIEDRVNQYMGAFLILEGLMVGVFSALDALLFYVFWEAMLIPMFLIIGIWGGPRRVYATIKFFLYTFLGSVLMLVALLYLYRLTGSFDLAAMQAVALTATEQKLIFIAFLLAFAVKVPMWPVHTWLPDAHVEAPTAGSVILAGILLKMGGYGFLRFSLPMFPDASIYFAPMIFSLSVIAIIYTSLVALMQEDIKKLIAYSSVAHMGFVTMGLFALNRQGVDGAVFQMISHGFISSALFLCVGVVYDRMHTREIKAYGGLVNRMPIYAAVFMVFTMGNVGLPGTSGFVGEFLTLVGAYKANTLVAILATTGVILSAAYALWLYWRVVFGELEKKSLADIDDMNLREVVVLAPLVAAALFFGFYPKPIFDMTGTAIQATLEGIDGKLKTAEAEPAP